MIRASVIAFFVSLLLLSSAQLFGCDPAALPCPPASCIVNVPGPP